MLRKSCLAWLTLVLLATFSPSQQPAEPSSLTPREKAKALESCLDRWQKAAQDVKTFEAEITRIEIDSGFGSRTEDSGVVKFMAPDCGLVDLKQKDKPETFTKILQNGSVVYVWQPELKRLIVLDIPKADGGIHNEWFQDLLPSLPVSSGEGSGSAQDSLFLHFAVLFHRKPADVLN
jgi:hypothetical protein